jgi:hypothetical protein
MNQLEGERKIIYHRLIFHLPGFPGRLRLRLLLEAGGSGGALGPPPEAEEVRLDMLLS